MLPKVGIEIQSTREIDATMLIAFFEKTNDLKVRKGKIAARGETDIVQILLMIVGTWAAERYVLDPLADKFDEWTEAITSLKGKQFRVSVHSQMGHLAAIETFRLSNPFLVVNLWRIVKTASDILAANLEKMCLDRIMIVPDKLEQPIVIGYQGTHPTHLFNLSSGEIVPIKTYDDRSGGDIETLLESL